MVVPGTTRLPVVVSIPHRGTQAPPGVHDADYARERYRTFRFGYADAWAGELYGELHRVGATVVSGGVSRLFVDLNRSRDAYEPVLDEVQSRKGVFRTHTVDGRPILTTPLTRRRAEIWLERIHDPYHAALNATLQRAVASFGTAFLLDCHTGSPRRLKGHEVVLGTRTGNACAPDHLDAIVEQVRSAGFACTVDLSGYRGGYVVRRHGRARGPIQAVQFELNADVVMRGSRRDYALARRDGRVAPHDPDRLAAIQHLVADIVADRGTALAGER